MRVSVGQHHLQKLHEVTPGWLVNSPVQYNAGKTRHVSELAHFCFESKSETETSHCQFLGTQL